MVLHLARDLTPSSPQEVSLAALASKVINGTEAEAQDRPLLKHLQLAWAQGVKGYCEDDILTKTVVRLMDLHPCMRTATPAASLIAAAIAPAICPVAIRTVDVGTMVDCDGDTDNSGMMQKGLMTIRALAAIGAFAAALQAYNHYMGMNIITEEEA